MWNIWTQIRTNTIKGVRECIWSYVKQICLWVKVNHLVFQINCSSLVFSTWRYTIILNRMQKMALSKYVIPAQTKNRQNNDIFSKP